MGVKIDTPIEEIKEWVDEEEIIKLILAGLL